MDRSKQKKGGKPDCSAFTRDPLRFRRLFFFIPFFLLLFASCSNTYPISILTVSTANETNATNATLFIKCLNFTDGTYDCGEIRGGDSFVYEVGGTKTMNITRDKIIIENVSINKFMWGEAYNLTMRQECFNDTRLTFSSSNSEAYKLQLEDNQSVDLVKIVATGFLRDESGGAKWRIRIKDCNSVDMVENYVSIQTVSTETTFYDSWTAVAFDDSPCTNSYYKLDLTELRGWGTLYVTNVELIKYMEG